MKHYITIDKRYHNKSTALNGQYRFFGGVCVCVGGGGGGEGGERGGGGGGGGRGGVEVGLKLALQDPPVWRSFDPSINHYMQQINHR